MGPWATMLDAQKFEVHVWHLGLTIDDVTKSIQTNVEHFHHAPQFSSNLPDIIAETAHDVIVFTDIGMDPIIQVLAALRLAPIQINGLGHPVASGLPTVDYVFGSELMEPADAQEHYTEELVLVPNLLWYHDSARIKVPALDADTAMQGKVIYLCSQSLFKLLPQYDDIYARIAERVENSEFWFIRHRSDYVNNLFERRLERAFAAHGLPYREFVVMQPRQDSDGFMRLNAAADILLDSFIWSGNVSTLEGIACGLPVITCPGPHCRSRHTYGILKLLEIEELIANSSDEYVNLAIRLGTDRAWREEMVAKFNTRKSRAYDDDAPVVAMSAFFDQICG